MFSKMKKGITLISILVSLVILATGIITLLKVFPVINKLSERGMDNTTVSMISDQIFAIIDKVYASGDNDIPPFIEGKFAEFPDYKYRIDFNEEKENLYKANIEISWKREGKFEKKYFEYTFRKK